MPLITARSSSRQPGDLLVWIRDNRVNRSVLITEVDHQLLNKTAGTYGRCLGGRDKPIGTQSPLIFQDWEWYFAYVKAPHRAWCSPLQTGRHDAYPVCAGQVSGKFDIEDPYGVRDLLRKVYRHTFEW